MAKKKNSRLDKLNALLDNLDIPADDEVITAPKRVIEDNDVPPPPLGIKNGKLGPTRNKTCKHFSWWNVEGKCEHLNCKQARKKEQCATDKQEK